MFNDRRPNSALSWIRRPVLLTPDAKHGTNRRTNRRLATSHKDDRWCAVPWDVSTRAIYHQSQVLANKEILDQLGAELPLHQAVVRNQADPTWPVVSLREHEAQFHEWACQMVFALADIGIFGAPDLDECLVFACDL